MNGGEVLLETLRSRGIDTIFYVAGGTYITVLEALSRQNTIRAVGTRLESSAVFAAEAYSALQRKPACVFVSRAPGATNASIGIHTAMQASRPVVLFIANIPQAVKQREAFQEIDYRLMYAPIAKAVFDVNSFDELAPVTARALDLSVSGRPGPVVVSVSRDILDGPTGEPTIPRATAPVRAGPEASALDAAVSLINQAKRPIIIAGEMVDFENAHRELTQFADNTGVGVMAAYRQQATFSNEHPAWFGQLSLNRSEHGEKALDECDLIIAMGTRLDSVTTDDYTMLRDGQKLIMVYPEPQTFAQWQPDVAMVANARPTLRALADRCAPGANDRIAWRDAINTVEREFSKPGDIQVHGQVNMAKVIGEFKAQVPKDAVLVADAGTFGRWIQRYYQYTMPDTSLAPVSGAMGYGVPGGIGAAVATPHRQVFVWVGDGGFLMTGQEAAVIVQEQLPIKIIVCDNSAWGSILVSQEKRFPGLNYGTLLRSPDFTMLGEGYGMPAFKVETSEAFGPALTAAMEVSGPAMIHLKLDSRDVSPFSASPADANPYKD
ncbi:MAG: acetolactate synthase-1/2/3 large subunit [Gammaproteobacteria bacterium]|jgi:acetolactate synthase-1/2/3 large subunit